MSDKSDNDLKSDAQPEAPRGKPWPKCLTTSLVALVSLALADLMDNMAGDFGLVAVIPQVLLLLFGLAAVIAFPMELYALIFASKPERPSMPHMMIAAPFWLIVVFVLREILLPFHDDTVRSRVSRARGDQRTLTVALETYQLDCNNYPAWSLDRAQNANGLDLRDKDNALQKIPTFRLAHASRLATLTTPVAYVTSYFKDPFAPVKGAAFAYWTNADAQRTTATGYILWSPGPDGAYDITIDNVARLYDPTGPVPSATLLKLAYDPSNGTQSAGDIYRYKQ